MAAIRDVMTGLLQGTGDGSRVGRHRVGQIGGRFTYFALAATQSDNEGIRT